MTPSPFWNSYLSSNANTRDLSQKLEECETAFADHKENISELIHRFNPSSIAVLGSGYLNDIPLKDLIQKNRVVYLVDWIEDVSKVGFSRKIIRKDENNCVNCLLCSDCYSDRYCKNFTGELLTDGLCTGYEPTSEPFDTCKNYEAATDPEFQKADITGGVAVHFTKRIELEIARCKSPKRAFQRAISIVTNTGFTPLKIESNSIDLVTSSMVLSQFDTEPYTYFATLLEERFGRDELIRCETILRPLMERLRTALFTHQVDAHLQEMHRILRKDVRSRAYLSAELFRSFPNSDSFFLVQDMPKALELISRYFHFEFDSQSKSQPLNRSSYGRGVSMNQCLILTPKTCI